MDPDGVSLDLNILARQIQNLRPPERVPGTWNGLAIRYIENDSMIVFDIGNHGVRTGGGGLTQTVDYQAAALAEAGRGTTDPALRL